MQPLLGVWQLAGLLFPWGSLMPCSDLGETQELGGSKLPHLDSSQHCPKALKIAQHGTWHQTVQVGAVCASESIV